MNGRLSRRNGLCLCFFVAFIMLFTSGAFSFVAVSKPEQVQRILLRSPPGFSASLIGNDDLSSKSQDDDLPQSISGYYKGEWKIESIDDRFQDTQFLGYDAGDLLMELRLGSDQSAPINSLHGTVVFKNGYHFTDDDIRFSIEGFFVPETNRLTSVISPGRDFRIEVSDSEIKQNSPHYREALRKEAMRWARSPPPMIKFGVPPEKQISLYHQCGFVMDLKLTNSTVHQSDDLYRNGLELFGSITSPNCNVTLGINASAFHLEKYYTKAVHYTLVIAVLTFVQILLLIKQIEGTSTPATSMRVSMVCISQQTVMDAYLCLLHLTVGITIEPLFNGFGMVSFFEFVLFAIFEMRYMLLIWRAQRGQSNENWDTRRELSTLYTRFYGVLLGGIIIIVKMKKYLKFVWLFLYSFWVPQIVHCVRSDLRQPLKPFFVFGMSVTRLILPLYLYGCPSNVVGIETNFWFCVVLVIYVSLQSGILQLQFSFGPHCFLPKRFRPQKHDYFRPLEEREIAEVLKRNGDSETGEGTIECVVCMNPVELRRPISRMVTPCGHFFHPQCLQRWMDVKMECPTCRQLLPPL